MSDIERIAGMLAGAKLRLTALGISIDLATQELIEFEKERLEALLALRAAELARDRWLDRNAARMAAAGGWH